ncbi:hypothetical protein [Halomonas gemina]|uniref:hypothetical protein n=1 Tax=Halomonas gemina TaxID=2945105 RepID=UPI003D340ABF
MGDEKSALDVYLSSMDRVDSTVQQVRQMMAGNEVSLLQMRDQVLKVAAMLKMHTGRIT